MSDQQNSNQKSQESEKDIYFFPPELFFKKPNIQVAHSVYRENVQKPTANRMRAKSMNFNLRNKLHSTPNGVQMRFK